VELVETAEKRMSANGNGHHGNGHQAAEVAAVLADFAQAERDLNAIDAELAAGERTRDAADRALADPDQRPTYLASLRLAEDRDAAQARIAELLEQRRPVAEAEARLRGWALPIRRRQAELAEMAAAIEAGELLGKVWQHLDAAIAAVEAARPACARSAGRVGISPSLEALVHQWSPGAIKRVRCELVTDPVSLASQREHVLRLRAGVPT
jgi:hypothetical protein